MKQSAIVGLICLLPSVANAGLSEIGPSFAVNAATLGNDYGPAVARSANGSFVVVWNRPGAEGNSSFGVVGRLFDADGNALTGEFLVNSYVTGSQARADVAMSDDGSFVIVWSSYEQDGDGRGVFGQRFTPTAAPRGTEFPVNTYTTEDQWAPRVAAHGDGSFVVVWDGSGPDSYDYYAEIFARLFDSDGSPRGAEFRANAQLDDWQYAAAVATAKNGEFVVVWKNDYERSSDAVGQRFDNDGAPLGTEFDASHAREGHTHLGVAAHANGGFVVTHEMYDYSNWIYARAFDGDGEPYGTQFRVSDPAGYWAYRWDPAISAGRDGYLVVWIGDFYYSTGTGLAGREVDPSGTLMGDEFLLAEDVWTPDVAGNQEGYVVTWRCWDGDAGGICAQVLCNDLDEDGVCDPDDLCAGFDDGDDADADGVADGCDPCSVIDIGQRITVKPQLSVQKIDSLSGDERLNAGGEFTLPGGKDMGDLNPAATGAGVAVLDGAGDVIVRVALPPGLFDGVSGWRVNGKGTIYSYRDKSRPPIHNGITSFSIQDRSHKVPSGIRVKVKGKDGAYPISSGQEPFQLAASVGNPVLGECGETVFGLGNCRFNAKGDKLSCR